MKSFESFLLDKEVVIVSKDMLLAESLVHDAKNRFDYHINLKVEEKNAKFVFENCYEAIRELLDALLILNGYKSYSHQAPIVFARDKGVITLKEAVILDNMRDLRNRLKYYGKQVEKQLVEEKREFFNDVFRKIMRTTRA